MRENGVYDRLVNEEPTAIGGTLINTLPGTDKMYKIRLDLNNIRSSIRSRDTNAQKIWLRPTIPWLLSCEYSDKISREEAFRIF